ncbi:MAG TPA: 3-methyl-2-oxobutanoate dehydrogenase subunit VorB [Candidatus Scatomorpha intestinigallinarum]|uniref:3-methyl-2-oxobutanoate dehydrogenase subunit VorB n=1 Tax=Candidatus Scatomorpha intestinigallinarum TaxID=2840923 RepID=A0A9D1IYZ5_9FIRM|nr:3-methyl-2-oxobutanoate dehydrogenase subunit VorB [Candidatus Scatomorpha intestinigallinarum]
MSKVLMKGNEAFAESCIRAGCRFFSGYPITPQTEILEYMSWRMEEVGGAFIQTESELAGVNMAFGAASAGARALTTSAGPGFSLKQEGISYLCGSDVPAVIADVMRIGSALGDIFQGQGDYWQLTRGGGHGDYRTIVLAPASVQENADLAYLAFDLAEKYRHPVIIGSDAAIGQMAEPVELHEMREHNIDEFDWAVHGRRKGEKQRVITNVYYQMGADNYMTYLREKYAQIEANEQRWESVCTEDAEIVLVAYGISSRVSKEAVKVARRRGMKLGLIRPITLWPFPKKAFDALGEQVKGFLCVEMSILGQMRDDVVLACGNRRPVEDYGEFANVPSVDVILEMAGEMLKKY